MRQRAFVVINPRAGRCNPEQVARLVRSDFARASVEYELHVSAGDERLRETVRRKLRDGCPLVVVAGGDGTVSSVANELAGSTVPIGIIPAGTGNMLARDLGIPLEAADAVGLVAGPHGIRTIDAMRIGDRLYFLTAGVGVSSLTVRDLRRRDKRRFGLLAYVATAVGKLFAFRSTRFEVTVDGTRHRIASVEVAVANSGAVADMVLSRMPDIRPDDGVLDVIIVAARGPLDLPRLVLGVLRRRMPPPSLLLLRATREIVVQPAETLPVQADGDVIGVSPLEVRVVPGAVKVIVPPPTREAPARERPQSPRGATT